jgi:hypothetical protein
VTFPATSGRPGDDAELWLRRIGEEVLLLGPTGRSERPNEGRIRDAAEAVVAVGALDPPTADAVVRVYERALALRGRPTPAGFDPPARKTATPSPARPPRVAGIHVRVDRPWGELELRRALLTDDATVITVGAHEVRPGALTGRPLPSPSIADDRGTTTTGTVAGGRPHDRGGYAAELVTTTPLAPTTAWIELDGVRFALHDPPTAACTVVTEDLDPAAAGERHVRRCLARRLTTMGPMDVHLPTVLRTLVAVGALAPDGTAHAEVAAVLAAGAPGAHGGGPGRAPRPGTPSSSPAHLPEPWRSVLTRRGQRDGRDGLIGLDARIPDLDGDGSSADLTALLCGPGDFALLGDVVVRGHRPAAGWAPTFAGRAWTWWAEDDLGGHYLGTLGGGLYPVPSLRFVPSLAPAARELRILPTGRGRRAVVTVALDPVGGVVR